MTRQTNASAVAAAHKADAITKTLAMAQSYHTQGQLKLAEGFYKQVLTLDANNADALHFLGVIALQSNDLKESIRLLNKARRRNAGEPTILINLGSALRRAGRLDEARVAYEEAIRLNPKVAGAHYNLGRVFFDLEQFEDAIGCYERALALKPNDADAYVNLGNAYKNLFEKDKALVAYQRAVELSPTLAEAYGNIASIYTDYCQHEEALAYLEKAIALKPEPGELRVKKSLLLLRMGRFLEGWKEYDNRFFLEKEATPRSSEPPPYWRGEDLSDKTILLWTEQGLGDEILYGRMIKDVADHAQKCILECSSRMVPVFQRAFPQIEVASYELHGKRTSPASASDFQCPVASLGQYFPPDFKDERRRHGYLKANTFRAGELRAKYQALAPGNKVVGISWRSNKKVENIAKSSELVAWQPVLLTPGVTFINLQYGDCDEDLERVRKKIGIEIYQDREVDSLRNMDDFFSQVAAMDFVVTTSNTTVHVAGSLNIPTFLMIPPPSSSLWYWLMEGDTTPWYPSVRVFRAELKNYVKESIDWRECIARIRLSLEAAVARQRADTAVATLGGEMK